MRCRTWAFLAVLALVVGGAVGCVTSSTVTDGDRQVVDQGRKAVGTAVESMERVRKAAPEGSEAWTLLGVGLAALADVELGAAHLQTVHGPPAEPKPYSHENMLAAIEQSKKEHAGTPWGMIALGVASAAAGVAGTLLGVPWLSRIFPALAGPWKTVAETGVQMVTALRQKSEESGGLKTKDLLKIANEYVVSAGVEKIVRPMASKFEEKLGFHPAVKLEEPSPTAPAAAPAPAPTT